MNVLARWSLGSSFAGAIIWASCAFLTPLSYGVGTLGWLFLFAPLVILPLVLVLVRTPDRDGKDLLIYRSVVLLQPFCAAGVLVSFFLPAGPVSGMLAAGWLFLTLLVAVFGFLRGLVRFLQRGAAPIEEVCIDAGLIYFALGGAWIFVSRLGLQPLGFSDVVVLLTAIHFHYAGGALQIIAGLAGRSLRPVSSGKRPFQAAAYGVIAGPPLLAAGITLSPFLEWTAALILAASVLLLALLLLFFILPRTGSKLAQFLFLIASGSVAVSMSFACAYAYGEWTHQNLVSINYMADIHGTANAFGFTLCCLLAFIRTRPEPGTERSWIP